MDLTWLGLSLALHLRYLTPCWVAELLLQSALFWLKRIEAQLLLWSENHHGKCSRRTIVNSGRGWWNWYQEYVVAAQKGVMIYLANPLTFNTWLHVPQCNSQCFLSKRFLHSGNLGFLWLFWCLLSFSTKLNQLNSSVVCFTWVVNLY